MPMKHTTGKAQPSTVPMIWIEMVMREDMRYESSQPSHDAAFFRWCESIGLNLYGFDCWVEVEPFEALDETLEEFRRAVEFASALDLGLIISHDTWAHTNAGRSSVDQRRSVPSGCGNDHGCEPETRLRTTSRHAEHGGFVVHRLH
jgi:sugar phosphate isomerase/epimerase